MTKSELIERIVTHQGQLSSKDVELAIKTMLEQGVSEAHREVRPSAPLSEMGQRFLRHPAYFAQEVAS